jgi:hypothetical protein
VAIVTLWFTPIAFILYLPTLQKSLKKCAPASRTTKPGMVWLFLIPFFGFIWQFFVVLNMTKSLGDEFARLGILRPEPALGKNIGLTMCICNCGLFIPLPGRLGSIPGLVLWIACLKRIANYSRVLDAHQTVTPASTIA